MSLENTLIYAGATAAAIGISSCGFACAEIESTTTKIENVEDSLAKAKNKAGEEVNASSDPLRISQEMERCSSIESACGATYADEIGAVRQEVAKTVLNQCFMLPSGKAFDACLGSTVRGLNGSSIPQVKHLMTCHESATECYSGIKKN